MVQNSSSEEKIFDTDIIPDGQACLEKMWMLVSK